MLSSKCSTMFGTIVDNTFLFLGVVLTSSASEHPLLSLEVMFSDSLPNSFTGICHAAMSPVPS